ncbi:MAG: hypothetical protein JWM14_296 [Chitinophagaceae bacterium]|nr:hypothetical protein [Chitinophagaceae bacterium]
MKTPLIVIFLLVILNTAFSQTLEQKWGRMLEKAENYEPYKVIKKTELADFWKSTKDSIQRYQKELKTERGLIVSQKSEIGVLKAQTVELTNKLSQNETDKNSVSFLGIKANKFAYLSTLCLLLVIALVGIGLLYYLYANSNAIAVQKVSAYQMLSKEFDEYKYSKIEMERKLRRELQTQVNKLEELKKGNG